MRLLAPVSYRTATPIERSRVCNGCGGAATGWLTYVVGWFVPSTIHGVDATPACNIHDWMYAHGDGKFFSDLIFLCNLLMLCWHGGSRRLYPWRAVRCMIFYLAVVIFGRRFYGRKLALQQLRRRGRG